VKIELSNFSRLIIGNNCEIHENTEIILKDNGDVIIGDNCKVKTTCCISAHKNSSIVISDSCIIGKESLIGSRGNSKINIGKKTKINSAIYMVADENSDISIGEDCTFSHYIKIRSNDGHGIFDIKNKKDINFGTKRSVKIGNHVWVGLSATILYNSVIGNGSIVGANTFVKSKFPNNCILAGIPAKITKKNIAWCGANINYEKFDELYGSNEYIKCFTQELE
jgi:acetyltransferase-like isoleucine patch superfamily enzyme